LDMDWHEHRPGRHWQVRTNHGYEEWTIGADGLIAESKGHFDEAEYQRQLTSGAPPAR
jgi:hypothetical protein